MPTFTAPDGARLYYTDEGQGTPVLALAGLTRNGTDFDYLAPHLSGTRLIRMDYRGRGKSDWTGAETYTIPVEAGDALALLDHLGIERAAIIGTSRGGLIAMLIAATATHRLTGVCLVDIGPELEPAGLDIIKNYVGRNPAERTLDEAVAMRANLLKGFENVPESRWREEVEKHYLETPDGLEINYDPTIRDAVIAAGTQPSPDLWPLFDAMAGLPVAVIRGANSDLLSASTLSAMQVRRPDLITAEVPGRGHVPFLDEPEALVAISRWLERIE